MKSDPQNWRSLKPRRALIPVRRWRVMLKQELAAMAGEKREAQRKRRMIRAAAKRGAIEI